MYIVWDIKERKQVGGNHKAYKTARNRAEKLNMEYGAHRYTYKLEKEVETV